MGTTTSPPLSGEDIIDGGPSTDRCDGGTVKEKLLAHDDGARSLTYNILEGVLPVSSYVSTVTVREAPGGGSTVEWKGTFKRRSLADEPPAGEDDATAINTMTAVYEGGLASLKKSLETR